MKTKEEMKKYREMDALKLEKELGSLEKRLEYDILKVKASKLPDYSLIRKTRKSIARLKTLISMSVE